MAVRMRRAVSEADKGQRREEILAAAKRVFAEHGFHGTAIADVARAAEISYGSVYWYFDSKEALFAAVREREEEALWRHVAAALGGVDPDDPEATLGGAVKATLEHFAADPSSVRLLSLERFTDDIERLVADAQRRGQVLDAPARVIAFSVTSLIGAIAEKMETDAALDVVATADFLVTFLLNGLRPR
jgi:AcrR family transcriptional regulator